MNFNPNKRVTGVQIPCKNCNKMFFYGVEEGSELPKILFCPFCNRLVRGNLKDLVKGG